MAKFLFLLFTLFILTNTYGQLTTITGKPRPLTEHEIEKDKRNHNCFYKKKYSNTQRLQFFPFNRATEIKLVSFDKPDSIIMGGELPMKNDDVDYSKLKEIKTIGKAQIDILTDILFNRSYGGQFYSFSESMCYNPRNAFLFIDSKGRTFGLLKFVLNVKDIDSAHKK